MTRFLIFMSVFFSGLSYAVDFTEVDIQYKERYFKTYKQILETRSSYEKIISSQNLTGEDLVYAVGQVAKLDLVIADYLPELTTISKDQRKEASEHCMSVIQKIKTLSPEQYTRFGLRCTYTRYLHMPLLDFHNIGDRIREFTADRPEKPSGIDGGDYWRAISQMKMHRRLGQAPTSFRDYEEALKTSRLPMNIAAKELRPLGQQYAGVEYYETDLIYGKAKINFGITNNKKEIIREVLRNWESKIGEMDFLEEIGEEKYFLRQLENRAIRKRMERYILIIDPCIKKSDWHGCIYDGGLDLEY